VTSPVEVLHLTAAQAAAIAQEARRQEPAEACGFLQGTINGSSARVHAVCPAPNRAQRRDRFLIDAADVFAALQAARAAGEEVLGVYHSHPGGPAEPSAIDRRDAWGEWLHLIVALRRGGPTEMRCWRPAGDAGPKTSTVGETGTAVSAAGEAVSTAGDIGFFPVEIRAEGA
jgi:proteasome lid subunit RPN8/RPN11